MDAGARERLLKDAEADEETAAGFGESEDARVIAGRAADIRAAVAAADEAERLRGERDAVIAMHIMETPELDPVCLTAVMKYIVALPGKRLLGSVLWVVRDTHKAAVNEVRAAAGLKEGE